MCTWALATLTIMIDRAQNLELTHHDMYKVKGSFNTDLLEKAVHVDAWRLMREEQHNRDTSKRNLIALLHRSKRTKATDQRDIIYSLFGLMTDSERAAIRVDYSPSHTVADVFMDVARYCVTTEQGGNLLVQAGLSPLRKVPNLPSWVPDWTSTNCNPLNTGIYNACSNLLKPFEVLADGRTIIVTGHKVSTVAQVGIPVTYPHGVLERSGREPSKEQYSLHEILIAAAVLCELAREAYPQYALRHEDWSEVLRRTCVMDQHWSGRRLTYADRPEFDACIAAIGFGSDVFEAIKEGATTNSSVEADEIATRINALLYGINVSQFQKGRVMALLKGGLLGCMPNGTREGDVVVILFGGWVPFVLRPLEAGVYELVGHCYVHGIMDGEWIEAVLGSITNPADFAFDDVFETFHIR